MRRVSMILFVLAAAAAVAPAGGQQPDDLRRLADESRKVAADLLAQVRGELTRELEISGPLKAVVVCKYTVPEITSAISRRTGWRVTRVSLRPRNPALGSADAWEQKVLMDFERRIKAGEKAEGMEHAEVVEEPAGRYFRYMRALPTGPLCVSCHGPTQSLSEALKSQLSTEYPHDRAVGFSAGELRGATSIKRPL